MEKKCPDFAIKVSWFWKKVPCVYICGLNSHLKCSFKRVLEKKHQNFSLRSPSFAVHEKFIEMPRFQKTSPSPKMSWLRTCIWKFITLVLTETTTWSYQDLLKFLWLKNCSFWNIVIPGRSFSRITSHEDLAVVPGRFLRSQVLWGLAGSRRFQEKGSGSPGGFRGSQESRRVPGVLGSWVSVQLSDHPIDISYFISKIY